MQTKIMTIFTRTPLHVGAGSSVGAIDQPVIRERHTGFPVIPGSAIKGVLRDYATGQKIADIEKLFGHEPTGKEDNAYAGAIGFGEARLLAFPLRSAKGSFALATCPLALARFARDGGLTFAIPQVADNECLASASVKLDSDKVAMEEYVFEAKGDFPSDWAENLSGLLNDVVLKEAKAHFVLLSDGDFQHFAKNACQVQHHNRIDSETGTVVEGALFNTETVPSETLFYAPLHALKDDCTDNELFKHFSEDERLLQFGGDGTTGLGFCTCKLG
jgi:CRISPR-associated protein Cmr4